MLKYSLQIFLLLLIGFTNTLSAQMNKIKTNAEKYQDFGCELPQFNIETTKGKTLTNKDLKSENHLFLVFFNPDCGHCVEVTRLFCNNANLFKHSKVVFLPYESKMSAHFNDFIKSTKLNEHPEFILGVNKTKSVRKLTRIGMYPQINIYDQNQQIIKIFNGNISLNKLKAYLP